MKGLVKKVQKLVTVTTQPCEMQKSYNNEFILDSARTGSEIICWKATKTISNYCISKSHTCHITFSLLQHVLKMPSSSPNASGKRWHHSQATSSTAYISQGNVAILSKWGGQNYSRMRRVFFWCCTPKIIKIGSAYATQSYYKNNSRTFLWTTVYV